MNKSNISKVINKMKMFFLFSMLPVSVAAVFDPSLIIDRKTLAELSQKLEDFFNNHGFFSTCCKPAEENDEIVIVGRKENCKSPLQELAKLTMVS